MAAGLLALFATLAVAYLGPAMGGAAGPNQAGTTVSANITKNTTWTKAGSPYLIMANVEVESNVTLWIAEGVEVRFGNQTGMTVWGTLNASGTSAEPVLFTSVTKTPGSWNGIQVIGPSTFQYATIEYGRTPLDILVGVDVTMTQSLVRYGGSHGVSIAGGGVRRSITSTALESNGGYPIFVQGGADPVLRAITATGNITDAIGVHDFVAWPGDYAIWEKAGLPYEVTSSSWLGVDVAQAATLAIEPGVEVRVGQGKRIAVTGQLVAVGTATQPITFTGTSKTPGWWDAIFLMSRTEPSILKHCDIGYGGTLHLVSALGIVENCTIHDSATVGISAPGAWGAPSIRNNRIEGNAFGLTGTVADLTTSPVDARYNWWGSASGPFHASANPGGQGNAVGGQVIFDPWLRSPEEATPSGLNVDLAGPGLATPGGTETYGVIYSNDTGQTVNDVVLVVALPSYADYLDDSGGGILWPQRRQLFWKLGSLPPGRDGILSFRVTYWWGLPDGIRDSSVAFIAGSNLQLASFDVSPYLSYVPTLLVSEAELSPSDVQAERQAYPALDQLYQQAIAEGYAFGTASRQTLSQGDPMTLIVLVKAAEESATYLRRQGNDVVATVVDRTSYSIRTPGGGLRFDSDTDTYELLGNWAQSGVSVFAQADEPIFRRCMKNCILEKVPGYLLKKAIRAVAAAARSLDCVKAFLGDELSWPKCAQVIKKIPGVSEGVDVYRCKLDCEADPSSHDCKKDKRECESYLGDFFGIDAIVTYKCDTETGMWFTFPAEKEVCALNEKCVEGPNGPTCRCKAPTQSPQALAQGARWQTKVVTQGAAVVRASSSDDESCCRIVAAKDPNAKYGPEGDVLPGQWMTYTITLENEGAGNAYDVFVMDRLSEYLDESSLAISGGGSYITGTRTLFWSIGELAPKGQPGSTGVVSFTVPLRPNLPSGTVVFNQAVVHFPSVPEQLATNPVVNVVQPLVAQGQEVEAVAGQPVSITLNGRDAAGSPLTYQITEPLLYGEVTGTPPQLTYIPSQNFSGVDRLRFTVNNAITTSRPAEVQVLVRPSPTDTTPPTVAWTAPQDGETIAVRATPWATSASGPLYQPLIRVQFSEAMSSTMATADTVRLAEGSGRQVPLAVTYDGSVNQVIAFPKEPLKGGTTYNVSVAAGVADAAGNRLAAPYTWSFSTLGQSSLSIFLPAVFKQAASGW